MTEKITISINNDNNLSLKIPLSPEFLIQYLQTMIKNQKLPFDLCPNCIYKISELNINGRALQIENNHNQILFKKEMDEEIKKLEKKTFEIQRIEENKKLQREKLEKEEEEILEKEQERLEKEQERLEKEILEKEQERLEKEQERLEKEKLEKEEQEKLEKEEKEKLEKEEKEKLEKEKIEKEQNQIQEKELHFYTPTNSLPRSNESVRKIKKPVSSPKKLLKLNIEKNVSYKNINNDYNNFNENNQIKFGIPQKLNTIRNISKEILIFPFLFCVNCQEERDKKRKEKKKKKKEKRFPILGNAYDCLDCPAGPRTALCFECHELLEKGIIVHYQKDDIEKVKKEKLLHQLSHLDINGYSLLTLETWKNTQISENFKNEKFSKKISKNFLLRPCFYSILEKESHYAASSCILNFQATIFIITCIHTLSKVAFEVDLKIFGNKKFDSLELKKNLFKVEFYDLFEKNWFLSKNLVLELNEMLPIPNLMPGMPPFVSQDFCGFKIPNEKQKEFSSFSQKLSLSLPKIGDPLFLISRLNDFNFFGNNILENENWNLMCFVVVEVSKEVLIVKSCWEDGFQNEMTWNHPSGSPLLDINGNITGIIVGMGFLTDGTTLLSACNCESIALHLNSIQN